MELEKQLRFDVFDCSCCVRLIPIVCTNRYPPGQVMQHPWFKDVDWDTITADRILRQEVVSPYDGDTDYNPRYGQERGCDKAAADAELSSAESIDPEDDAKYFGSF